jgi:hypothetical protein
MNTNRHKSGPPNKKLQPKKLLFKPVPGETEQEFAERLVRESLAKFLKPGPFQPPPQNPN